MKNNSVYKDATIFSALIFLLGIVELIILCIFLSPRMDILIGTLYGCVFVSLNFFYLAYSVKKSSAKEESKAKAHMSFTYMVRMLLTGVMIIIAAKVKWIHIWAAIIPLVFQRIAVPITASISLRNKGSENS